MPDRSLTVATYAAGASLAAITLIYVFAPTYFLDGDQAPSSTGVFGSRKKSIVGLSNPANDCFINSILQALAGLQDLRVYLIHETHRRSLDDGLVYRRLVLDDSADTAGGSGARSGKQLPDWKVEGLQMGIVTEGLKHMLDALNERPIYKKTISAGPFVRTLEIAFRQRISRQQQDAQEFLQVVAERLCDEYHAGRRAREFARDKATRAYLTLVPQDTSGTATSDSVAHGSDENEKDAAAGDRADRGSAGAPIGPSVDDEEENIDDDQGFPLEGKFESQIECLTCGFKPRPTESTFCSLTLNVPQTSSTTLGACFDGMFKTEYIDDFKCEKCRLVHALEALRSASATSTGKGHEDALVAIAKLQHAIDTDPENPPKEVALPDLRLAPKRRIARHIRLTHFPRVLAIHLSRSIFDASYMSQKNSAKVSFPERLPLGGLLQQRKYKLRGLVTHKGSHHSGHYETFRRQDVSPPFSNPNTFQPSGLYSKTASISSTPRVGASGQKSGQDLSPAASAPDLIPPATDADRSTTPLNTAPPGDVISPNTETDLSMPPAATNFDPSCLPTRETHVDTASFRPATSPLAGLASQNGTTLGMSSGIELKTARPGSATKSKRPKSHDKWWRISDDKVKLASTSDVLGMQKEVYLLFYELDSTDR
ncbi:ubiquitin c-terminal hydrolase [Echria macrotheca]|uniref:Ubiquitin carboxyl-terminal hydrolase n=1 Tax=Echria macrotheca TaxID=438768 RepID=A0AAJ0F843_9PEZI|nr:ubiquitin c-terminal hydrolase [Echria macrotheca]